LEALVIEERDNFASIELHGIAWQVLLAAPRLLLVNLLGSVPASEIFEYFAKELAEVVSLLGGAHEDERDQS
jgi:hypothetical protein